MGLLSQFLSSMHNLLVFTAVVLVIAGVFFSKISKKENEIPESSQVLSVEEEKEEEKVTPTVGSHQVETATPTKTLTPFPTNTPKPASSNLSSYQYPNSQVVSSGDNSLILNSTDNADTITDWYKEKIKGEGMSVTSFVTTKTNDNVLNKLVGADGEREIRVEITKDAASSTVKISVSLN